MRTKPLSILALLLIAAGAWAQDAPSVVASGDCGTNITWTLTDDGVLTISGTGAMADFTGEDPAPWRSNRSNISSVIIEPGVTSIGNGAFGSYTNLRSVTIPASVTSIGEKAFSSSGLSSVTIPAGVESIGKEAFYNCGGLSSVTIPASVERIGSKAFSNSSTLNVTVYAPECTIGGNAFGGYNNSGLYIYVFDDCWNTYTSLSSIWERYDDNGRIHSINVILSGVTARQDPKNTSNYWCTYYHPQANVKIKTEGVQIFKASLSEDNLTLTKVDGNVIKAGQAVVLKATAAAASDDLDMELTPATPTGDFTGNQLKGTTDVMTGEAGNIYVLSANANTGAGFYKLKTTATLGANKAYLVYDGSATGARDFFGFGEETGISLTINPSPSGEGSIYYTVDGRRVSQPTKGLYIVDGKKVVIK